MRSDLEVEEQVRVKDRCKQEDSSKGTRDERDKSDAYVSTERVDHTIR